MAEEPLQIFKDNAERQSKFVRESLGVAEDVWDNMSAADKAALVLSPVPVAGTAAGLFADSLAMKEDPSAVNTAILASNFIPFSRVGRFAVKAGQSRGLFTANPLTAIKSKAYEMLSNIPNYVPGFYDKNQAKGIAGLMGVTAQGIIDTGIGRLSPQAMGNLAVGVGRGQQRVARRQLKKFDTSDERAAKVQSKLDALPEEELAKRSELMTKVVEKTNRAMETLPGGRKVEKFLGGPLEMPKTKKARLQNKIRMIKKDKTDAFKKISGQVNAQRMYNDQYYKTQGEFFEVLDGLDQRDFAALDSKTYHDVVKGATGLTKEETDLVFQKIAKVWDVDPAKNYRMAIRNPTTEASGKFIDPVRKGIKRVLGGASKKDLEKVFSDGPFSGGANYKSQNLHYKDMYDDLKKVDNIRIVNPDGYKAGEPAILMGYDKSNAYELGGVNYITTIKPNGKMTTFVSDENDLLNIPIGGGKTKAVKAPLADRLVTVVTPFEFDLVNKTETNLKRAEGVRESVEQTMREIAGPTTRKLPKGGPSKANLATAEAIANLKAKPDYLGAGLNILGVGAKAGKPIYRGATREEEQQ